MRIGMTNEAIADAIEGVGTLLEAQEANPFRVRAYHRCAEILRDLEHPVTDLLEAGGPAALERIPGIGPSLASAVEELAHTGRLSLLDRLEGQVSPEDLFTTIPGIGEGLAHRIHEDLGIETLEGLEQAAADGTLESVRGIGPRRRRAIRDLLAVRLGRAARRRRRRRRVLSESRGHAQPPVFEPHVETILEVDEEYRRRAAAGTLRRIRPKRFNPEGKAWLPVYHTERRGWWFTALYSNTRRAHALGRTRDWVVVFYERDGHEDQSTVVTEYRGELAGRRVVRGREMECYEHYYPLQSGFGASPR
ncbi:MAG: helix-hairpin-helix domain-containing protein [Gemmatimonadota bacterium]|nr:helix-hairpin-helix domain-containing protein [Gemmatimonadota bacterium]